MKQDDIERKRPRWKAFGYDFALVTEVGLTLVAEVNYRKSDEEDWRRGVAVLSTDMDEVAYMLTALWEPTEVHDSVRRNIELSIGKSVLSSECLVVGFDRVMKRAYFKQYVDNEKLE